MLNFPFLTYRKLLSTNDQYILSVFQLFKEFGYKRLLCFSSLFVFFFEEHRNQICKLFEIASGDSKLELVHKYRLHTSRLAILVISKRLNLT